MTFVNLIVGWERDANFSAMRKTADCLQNALTSPFSGRVVSCRPLPTGLGEEITNYLRYPFVVRRFSRHGINHITTQEYAYLPLLMKLPKLVVTCHDIFPVTVDRDSVRWNYLMRISIGLKGMAHAQKILCVSDYTRRELEKLGIPSGKLTTVHSGHDPELYKPQSCEPLYDKYGLSRGVPYLLYHGSEIDRKNFFGVIRAFAQAKKQIPALKLLKTSVSQHDGNRKKALDMIKRLGLQDDVRFFGYIDEKELPLFYNLADAFVFPSFAEGFGMPVLEAMACGCPVVASNQTSIPEVAGDAAVLVDPKNTDAIAKGVVDVLQSSALRKRLRTRGFKQAKRFTWQMYAKKVMEAYESLV
jgi:glycosyltransferase involved in cell wall biosynthesis